MIVLWIVVAVEEIKHHASVVSLTLTTCLQAPYSVFRPPLAPPQIYSFLTIGCLFHGSFDQASNEARRSPYAKQPLGTQILSSLGQESSQEHQHWQLKFCGPLLS